MSKTCTHKTCDVRFWAQSGHHADKPERLLLTQSGHSRSRWNHPGSDPSHRYMKGTVIKAERKFSHNTMLADLFWVPHLEVPRRFEVPTARFYHGNGRVWESQDFRLW